MSAIITATQLLAKTAGPQRCYYCAAPCGAEHRASDLVKSSFTARDTVRGGDFVCPGCVVAMDESATVQLPDGSVREGQKFRCYSWLLTPERRIAATKSHLSWLRAACLSPPSPPYAIVLSDSGQKHLVYRGVVCRSQEFAVVTLEGLRVDYTATALADRLALCATIVAATGKPVLQEPMSHQAAMRVVAHCGQEEIVATWQAVREEPLSQLAAWLCPNKEECLHEHPPVA